MVFRNHLFKGKVQLLNRSLDAYALRQRTIGKNIANATSTDYRPEKVRFEELFHKQKVAIKGLRSEEMHIPFGRLDDSEIEGDVAKSGIPQPEVYFSGENHVNIDREMAELAQNQIRFRFASQSLGKYFKGLSGAITGSSSY